MQNLWEFVRIHVQRISKNFVSASPKLSNLRKFEINQRSSEDDQKL